MKGITSKLLAGMSDYCNFIFTVGEKTEIMAKMVSDYTQKTLREIKGAKSEWDKVFQSKTSNTYKTKLWGDMYKSGDVNQELDALLGRNYGELEFGGSKPLSLASFNHFRPMAISSLTPVPKK